MPNDWIVELDRKLDDSWFDGVLAALAAGAITAALRGFVGLLAVL